MLKLAEVRIGNFFEIQYSPDEKNITGKVMEVTQKQVLVNRKWVNLNCLWSISITKDILLHAGFTEFGWAHDSSVFQSNHFKCTLGNDGLNLFCDSLKNLRPIKYLHELQNLYFDLTGEELEINLNAKLVRPQYQEA